MRWEVSHQRLLSHQLMVDSYTWSGFTIRTVWNRSVFVCLCFQPTDSTRWFPNLSSSWICSPTGMCGRTADGWRWARYESYTVKNIRPISQNLSDISWSSFRFLYQSKERKKNIFVLASSFSTETTLLVIFALKVSRTENHYKGRNTQICYFRKISHPRMSFIHIVRNALWNFY